MLPNPYVLLALAVAWAGSCGLAYYKGGEHRENAIVAEQARLASEDAERQRRIAQLAAERRAGARTINRALDDEVHRYATSDAARADCFDADGLQLFNALATGTVPVRGGGAGAGLPARAPEGPER